ncbi:unnamed protein product [Cyprideis torosa]|uniref:Uncharacterized protein n=1 Tax=Cyprideis torosa TaxID=163714 RepID=A0A7R8WFR5_9CRUS|nr:unnamed protein product [Cyprideis torosa]CAG0897218.1 unnamed protein product [Cyprideis torosa]
MTDASQTQGPSTGGANSPIDVTQLAGVSTPVLIDRTRSLTEEIRAAVEADSAEEVKELLPTLVSELRSLTLEIGERDQGREPERGAGIGNQVFVRGPRFSVKDLTDFADPGPRESSDQARNLQTQTGWGASELVGVLRMRVSGVLGQTAIAQATTPEEVYECLKRNFGGTKESGQRLLSKLFQLRQEPGEKAFSFANRIRGLATSAYAGEPGIDQGLVTNVCAQVFIAGLSDFSVRQHVASCQTLENALTIAESQEAIRPVVDQFARTSGRPVIPRLPPRPIMLVNMEGRCYRCLEAGHYASKQRNSPMQTTDERTTEDSETKRNQVTASKGGALEEKKATDQTRDEDDFPLITKLIDKHPDLGRRKLTDATGRRLTQNDRGKNQREPPLPTTASKEEHMNTDRADQVGQQHAPTKEEVRGGGDAETMTHLDRTDVQQSGESEIHGRSGEKGKKNNLRITRGRVLLTKELILPPRQVTHVRSRVKRQRMQPDVLFDHESQTLKEGPGEADDGSNNERGSEEVAVPVLFLGEGRLRGGAMSGDSISLLTPDDHIVVRIGNPTEKDVVLKEGTALGRVEDFDDPLEMLYLVLGIIVIAWGGSPLVSALHWDGPGPLSGGFGKPVFKTKDGVVTLTQVKIGWKTGEELDEQYYVSDFASEVIQFSACRITGACPRSCSEKSEDGVFRLIPPRSAIKREVGCETAARPSLCGGGDEEACIVTERNIIPGQDKWGVYMVGPRRDCILEVDQALTPSALTTRFHIPLRKTLGEVRKKGWALSSRDKIPKTDKEDPAAVVWKTNETGYMLYLVLGIIVIAWGGSPLVSAFHWDGPGPLSGGFGKPVFKTKDGVVTLTQVKIGWKTGEELDEQCSGVECGITGRLEGEIQPCSRLTKTSRECRFQVDANIIINGAMTSCYSVFDRDTEETVQLSFELKEVTCKRTLHLQYHISDYVSEVIQFSACRITGACPRSCSEKSEDGVFRLIPPRSAIKREVGCETAARPSLCGGGDEEACIVTERNIIPGQDKWGVYTVGPRRDCILEVDQALNPSAVTTRFHIPLRKTLGEVRKKGWVLSSRDKIPKTDKEDPAAVVCKTNETGYVISNPAERLNPRRTGVGAIQLRTDGGILAFHPDAISDVGDGILSLATQLEESSATLIDRARFVVTSDKEVTEIVPVYRDITIKVSHEARNEEFQGKPACVTGKVLRTQRWTKKIVVFLRLRTLCGGQRANISSRTLKTALQTLWIKKGNLTYAIFADELQETDHILLCTNSREEDALEELHDAGHDHCTKLWGPPHHVIFLRINDGQPGGLNRRREDAVTPERCQERGGDSHALASIAVGYRANDGRDTA